MNRQRRRHCCQCKLSACCVRRVLPVGVALIFVVRRVKFDVPAVVERADIVDAARSCSRERHAVSLAGTAASCGACRHRARERLNSTWPLRFAGGGACDGGSRATLPLAVRNPALATRRRQPGAGSPARAARRAQLGERNSAPATRHPQPGTRDPAHAIRHISSNTIHPTQRNPMHRSTPRCNAAVDRNRLYRRHRFPPQHPCAT